MMPRRRRSGCRVALAALLAVLALGLGGCVYLRLLQLKRQLADFDRHFALRTDTGVRLDCLQPVLLGDDIRWLGFEPATIGPAIGDGERWHIRWLKQKAPGDRTPRHFEIAFDLFLADDRLVGLSIPDRYFSILPKEVVVNAIKSLGGANVDKRDRRIESQVGLALGDSPHAWPTRATIASVLGDPTTADRTDDRLLWHYHFISADPEQKGKPLDLRLTFDTDSEKLTHIHGRLPVGRLSLSFAPQ